MTTFQMSGRVRSVRGRLPLGRNPLLLPITVFTGATLLGVALVVYVLWPTWPGARLNSDAPVLPITVAGVSFSLPQSAIRIPLQRRSGAHERIDLGFQWPSLEPPDPSTKQPHVDLSATRIFITIAAAGGTLAPVERMTIYPRYIADEASPGMKGLTVLPFRAGTPYEGEDLIFDAGRTGFLVRCTRNARGPIPGTCLHERRIGTAELMLRFPRDWLSDWRIVVTKIDQLIARIRPTAAS
jgi:hypothetical protein